MAEHSNATIIRRGYTAFNSGDMETLRTLFTEDSVWHVPGRNQLSGDKQGREAVFAYFGKLGELTGGSFKVELHDLLANDEHVVGLQASTGQRNGKTLRDNGALVFRMRNGQVIEGREHTFDQQGSDAFWA